MVHFYDRKLVLKNSKIHSNLDTFTWEKPQFEFRSLLRPLIFFSTLKQRRGWDSGKWHQITWQVSSCETYHFDSVMHTKNLKCLCRPSSEIFREERTGKKGEIGSYIRQVELEVLQLGTTTTTLKPRNIFGLFVCSKLEIGLNSFGSVCSMHNSTI